VRAASSASQTLVIVSPRRKPHPTSPGDPMYGPAARWQEGREFGWWCCGLASMLLELRTEWIRKERHVGRGVGIAPVQN
jgi:hypothetical protein